MKEHHYKANTNWIGNQGTGTSNYRAYSRNHDLSVVGKPVIPASSDPSFRGDPARYNPEELLVSSISSCHMLWYLHLCSVNGVIVVDYKDEATGTMAETDDGSGFIKEVTLYPTVTVTDPAMIDKANSLHHEANKMCFIANSCNFPIQHQPTCIVQNA
jgi:organic hydroperoxide reductase OsmC/OhrA